MSEILDPTSRMIEYCKNSGITISDDPGRRYAGFYFIDKDGNTLSYIIVKQLADDASRTT